MIYCHPTDPHVFFAPVFIPEKSNEKNCSLKPLYDFKCKYNFFMLNQSDIFLNKKQNKTLTKSIKYQFSQTSRVEATAVLPDVVGLALDLIPAEVHVS